MYQKWQSYNVQFLRYQAWQTEFFVILDHFLPFYPPNNPKNQNFEKMETTTGDIIILHKCTKNHDHMLYNSLDMACNRCNCYFSFWTIIALLPPKQPKKSKFEKNEKNTRRYHFTIVYQKSWSYAILFLRSNVWQM